ncbi:MAG: GNAT family N-acetyltransferase [Oscillatoriales cyanobacterium RM1_1_9]|nr:GNAT family N-acetyltransferase [Oscillatoriales cyanobacterium SM2_3_0]NJO46491.1 GNAT family N-acetyltransferase [Oscillatoriales cyanobacterium RM2_1_1]NJO70932.1 GNAT family N-acetyltransferase [Oscillatoriales cyanobacterium RM1_1_9]
MNNVVIKSILYSDASEAIHKIRDQVFVAEQGIDPRLEFDGMDDRAKHFLAYSQAQPIGTVRVRNWSENTAKIERLAVLPAFRGQGIGTQIMEAALSDLSNAGVEQVIVYAQIHARPFYRKLNFVAQGEPFSEAGILHYKMAKCLTLRDPNI